MRKRIAAILLGAALLLGLAGCTPAAGNGEDTASPDTAASAIDQAAVEESAEPATETNSEAVPGEIDTTSDQNVDSSGTEESAAWETEEVTSEPVTSESDIPSEPNAGVPKDHVVYQLEGWGAARNPFGNDPNFPEVDPAYTPSFSEGGTPEDFITTTYDAADLAGMFESMCMLSPGQNVATAANQINAYYPFECVRKMDEDRFYVVYKVRQGGYYYLVFQKIRWLYSEKEDPAFMLTCASYVGNKRSYADYAQAIIPGTSIAEAEKVDFVWEYYKDYGVYKGNERVVARPILTDGMLYIGYRKNDAGDYVVTESEYFPDFKEAFIDIVHNSSILPSDYPA